jgi:hypothetical protein
MNILETVYFFLHQFMLFVSRIQILMTKSIEYVKKLIIYKKLVKIYNRFIITNNLTNNLTIEFIQDDDIVEVYLSNIGENEELDLNKLINRINYLNLNYDFCVIKYNKNIQIEKQINFNTILKQPVDYKPILVEIKFIDINDITHILKLDLTTNKYNCMIEDNVLNQAFFIYLIKNIYNIRIARNIEYSLKVIDHNINVNIFTEKYNILVTKQDFKQINK